MEGENEMLGVLEGVSLEVRVILGVMGGETEAVGVRVALHVPLGDTVRESVADGETVAVPLAVAETVAVRLVVALTVG